MYNKACVWKDKSKITDKQWKCIKILEEKYDIKFTGSTKSEASDFISKCIEKEKEEYWRDEALFDSFWGGMDQY